MIGQCQKVPLSQSLKKNILTRHRRDIWECAEGTQKLIYSPPRSFKFSLPMVLPHANVAMELDPQLRNARFELIPGTISERDFW